MANRDGVDAYRFSQVINRNFRLAEQGLKDFFFRAFHE
jgi:hypothetical protein